jgi:hypothetical protein
VELERFRLYPQALIAPLKRLQTKPVGPSYLGDVN